MIETAVEKSRRNLVRTRYAVVGAFVLNALTNVLLVGFFARRGGIDLVGSWAFLNAILLNVLILDFGFTNALTFRIGRDGVSAAMPALFWLLRRLVGMIVVVVIGAIVAFGLGHLAASGTGLTITAALMQLAANWLCAIRMGQHEQYWFNMQTITRVSVQSLAAVALFHRFPAYPYLVFGVAFLFGGAASLMLAFLLVRSSLGRVSQPVTFAQMRDLMAGFGIENITQRAFQPFAQLAVAHGLGTAALGAFTIALRIPIVVNQSVSEALRALLPGIAGALREHDVKNVQHLLRDALLTQLTIVLPVAIFLCVHATALLDVWVGQAPAETTLALRLLTGAMVFVCVAVPFYWTVQAAGGSRIMALSGSLRLMCVLLFGSGAMLMGGGLVSFVIVFALGQTGHSLFCLFVSHRKYSLVGPSFRGIRMPRIGGFLLATLVLNLVAGPKFANDESVVSLAILATLNAALIGAPGLLALRKQWFAKGQEF